MFLALFSINFISWHYFSNDKSFSLNFFAAFNFVIISSALWVLELSIYHLISVRFKKFSSIYKKSCTFVQNINNII